MRDRVYGPNIDSQPFFLDFTRKIEELNIDRKVIGGDLNFYMNPEDKTRSLLTYTQNQLK